jgi:hypothetical protein
MAVARRLTTFFVLGRRKSFVAGSGLLRFSAGSPGVG